MVKLTSLHSVSQWEREQISKYPEIGIFIEKLKEKVVDKPEKGIPNEMLSETGKIITLFIPLFCWLIILYFVKICPLFY